MAGEYHHIFCKAAVHVKNQTLVVKIARWMFSTSWHELL